MNIAVYTIALNEGQFIDRWYESAKEADFLLIVDTGSTDNTVELAESLGINVHHVRISPWRFDDARNSALSVIPMNIDMCIALDMDEVLMPGWREELEKSTSARPRYKYTWSWNEDGSPGLQYGGDKIHSRKNYRWKHPVHEVLNYYGEGQETQDWVGLEIHHHPDPTKSRGQYYPMLAMAVAEDPYDDRNAYYYARELYFVGRYEEAASEFKRHLSLPKAVWKPERAASMRYLAKCEPQNAKSWLEKAVAEDPNRKEAKVELAQWFYNNRDWKAAIDMAEQAVMITEKPLDYLCEAFAWGSLPWDILAICYWNLGEFDKALDKGHIALALSPNDERLKSNLEYYKSATLG